MQNRFYNQPVVAWAKQNLPQPRRVKLLVGSKIVMYLLAFIVPLVFISLFILLKLIGATNAGWGGVAICGFVFLIPSGMIALGGYLTRVKFVKLMDATGVVTISRRKHLWENLYYVDHVSKRVNRPGKDLIIKDNQLELVFADGKVVIPPLIHDREQMWSFIDSMPAQVRDDGEVRQVQPPAAGKPEDAPATPAFDDIVKAMQELKTQHDRNK